MEGLIYTIGGALAAGLVSAGVAWLLQRAMPRVHPVVIALITVVLLILLVILVAGLLIVRTLISIGESGQPPSIDGAVKHGYGVLAASLWIYGVLEIMLIGAIGLPAAIVAAFGRRRRDTGR